MGHSIQKQRNLANYIIDTYHDHIAHYASYSMPYIKHRPYNIFDYTAIAATQSPTPPLNAHGEKLMM